MRYWSYNKDIGNPPTNSESGMTNDWEVINALGILAGEVKEGENISPTSIPSPFARPWLFQEFLLDREKREANVDLSNRIDGEWRGFLSMLALCPIYKQWESLSISLIDVNDSKSIQSDIDKAILNFRLKDFNPDYVCCGDENVPKIGVISIDGQVVGMSSLSTVVCPNNVPRVKDPKNDNKPVKLNPRTESNVGNYLDAPWVRYDSDSSRCSFCDPIDELSRGEKMILFCWLSALKNKMKDESIIKNRIQEYVNALTMDANDKNILDENIPVHIVDYNNIRNNDIQKLLEMKVNLKSYSAAELKIHDTKDVHMLGMQEGKENKGNERLIHGFLDGSIYKRRIKENIPSTVMFDFGATEDRYIDPDKFFMDKIYCFYTRRNNENLSFNLNNRLHEGVSQTTINRHYTLPIERDVFNKLDMKIVSQAILRGYVDRANNKVKVTAKVKIDNGDDVEIISDEYIGNKIVVMAKHKKEYEENELKNALVAPVPTVCVYPNITGCNTYFLNNRLGDTIYYYFAPIGSYQIKGVDSKIISTKREYELNSCPKVLGCYLANNDSYVGAIDISCAFNSPASDNAEINNVKFCVDIGTSSSVISYNEDGQGELIPEIKDLYSIIIATKKDLFSLNEVSFPNESIKSPFPSILYKPNGYTNGHPYFLTSTESMPMGEDYKTNLKIKFALSDEMKTYLRKMFIYTLLFAKNKGLTENQINVHAAYPTSIKTIGKKSYESEMKGMFKTACKDLGYDNLELKTTTESKAAAQYFNNIITSEDGNIIIDIGGGTSDIFVGALRKGAYKKVGSHSKKAGARVMLLEPLNENKNYFASMVHKGEDYLKNTLLASSSYYKQKNYANISKGYFIPVTEWIFSCKDSGNETSAGDVLANVAASDFEAPGMMLKTIIAFQICSLTYYSGILFKTVSDMAGNKDENASFPIRVRLCGNGSKMALWIHEAEKNVENMVSKFVRHGAKSSHVFKTCFSDAPKKEIAYGLSRGEDFLGGANFNNIATTAYPMGEKYYETEKKQNVKKSESVIDNAGNWGTPVISDDIPAFTEFIKLVEEVFKGNSLIPIKFAQHGVGEHFIDGNINRINSIILDRNTLVDAANRRIAEHRVKNEPLFLILADEVRTALIKFWKDF